MRCVFFFFKQMSWGSGFSHPETPSPVKKKKIQPREWGFSRVLLSRWIVPVLWRQDFEALQPPLPPPVSALLLAFIAVSFQGWRRGEYGKLKFLRTLIFSWRHSESVARLWPISRILKRLIFTFFPPNIAAFMDVQILGGPSSVIAYSPPPPGHAVDVYRHYRFGTILGGLWGPRILFHMTTASLCWISSPK